MHDDKQGWGEIIPVHETFVFKSSVAKTKQDPNYTPRHFNSDTQDSASASAAAEKGDEPEVVSNQDSAASVEAASDTQVFTHVDRINARVPHVTASSDDAATDDSAPVAPLIPATPVASDASAPEQNDDQIDDVDLDDEPRKKARGTLDYFIVIALAFLCAWGLRTFVIEPYMVPTGSMISTIKIGDTLIGEKLSLHFQPPKPGDIVTFVDPDNPSQTLIKRVIATEGQVVNLSGGKVYVDGKPLDEPYVNGQPSFPITGKMSPNLTKPIAYPYKVPPHCIWVMGDNRENSLDSRYFGAVDVSTVTSRAKFIFWPLQDAALL